MITWCVHACSDFELRGIPSLEVAKSIATDLFRYGWYGEGHWYEDDNEVEVHANALPIEIADSEEFPEVLIVWRVVGIHDRLAIASIVAEHRCPACRRVV